MFAGIALHPRSFRRAFSVALFGVLVDVDHYVLYGLRSGDWNVFGALRYDRRRGRALRPGDTFPRYGSLRSFVHREVLTIPLVWLIAWRWSVLRPMAVGVSLHLALDTALPLRFDWRVWRRARGRCEWCGVGGLALGVYTVRLPQDGGAYWALANRAAWCGACARAVRQSDRA